MFFKKITLFLITISFIFTYFPQDNSSSETPLSPPTIFQPNLHERASEDYADLVRRHVKLITVAISVGEHLLIQRISLKRLERAIRFQFSDNRDFLRGVILKRIFYKDDIVKMPYRRDGAFYIVKICLKPSSSHPRRDRLEIAISRIR